jgi:hypothetical protein
MNGKLTFLVLLMILPLLTIAVTNMPDADAEGGEKSCSKKDKSMKGTSYNKSTEMSEKISKELEV